LEFLLEDFLTYKDLHHGTLEVTTKDPIPRTYIIDDPELELVISPRGSGSTDVQQFAYTGTQMANLLAASRDAAATRFLGDSFIQQRADLQQRDVTTALGGSGLGSGSPFDAFAVTPFTLAFTPGSTDFNKLVVPPPPVFDSRPPDAGELQVRRSVKVDTVDTTAPAAPVLDLVASDDTGSSSSDNLTNKASVHVSVAAEDGARVDLSDGQSAIASGGSVTFTVSLAAGDNTFTA